MVLSLPRWILLWLLLVVVSGPRDVVVKAKPVTKEIQDFLLETQLEAGPQHQPQEEGKSSSTGLRGRSDRPRDEAYDDEDDEEEEERELTGGNNNNPNLLDTACRIFDQAMVGILEADVQCDCTGKQAAVIVRQQATLDLHGHSIACANDTVPSKAVVIVYGSYSVVHNGTVTGEGASCVSLRGHGHHTLQNLKLPYCGGTGIHVDSPSNDVLANELEYCNQHGMLVLANHSHNRLVGNALSFLGDTGIVVAGRESVVSHNAVYQTSTGHGVSVTGDWNRRVSDNFVTYAGVNGMDVAGDENRILRNTVVHAAIDGIDITGSHNSARLNHVSCSGDDGLEVGRDAQDTWLVSNVIAGSGDDGIDVNGDLNFIQSNHVSGSADVGILVDGNGEHNVVTLNVVLGSGTSGNKNFNPDLFDANSYTCETNQWTDNTGHAVQDCIQ